MKTSNRSIERGIIALMFTNRQLGYHGGYWGLSLSGNCCPVCKLGRPRRPQPFVCALAWSADQRDYQPAEHQKVPRLGAAKVPLERVKHLVYLAGDACAIPHVSRSCVGWDVGCIQHTQERVFFQAFSRVTSRPKSSHPSLLSKYLR